ncbi:hypothetical protein AB0H88_33150 [Nonomuraea sp. NPDC050680]|uniref:hypothetical protein n=1 Tax=Nonomuraea sp. NPDC050680 TaxID=3154630 RepID=UPI0033FC5633
MAWLDLLAILAKSKEARTTSSLAVSLPTANRLRQIKNALESLQRARLVELGSARSNGRFESFELLDECGQYSHAGHPIRYRVPDRDETTLKLPIQFFTNGWVHALSPAEMATYLMLRHISQIYPSKHGTDGVFVTEKQRCEVYGIGRDAYESHILLNRYGLVERVKDSARRPDGRIANYQTNKILQPHRFQIASDTVFAQRAVDTVIQGLK